MKAIISTFLSTPDNVELIRDQIGAIIALESANQYALAIKAEVDDADDYDIGVYIENARPWDLSGEKKDSPFPLVNVMLEKVINESGSSAVSSQKYTATFDLDCYGCGNLAGGETDDQQAARKAWKVARIVRNIVMAGEYTYLGLQKIKDVQCVSSRKITKMSSGISGNMAESAQAVIVCRIELAVTYYESSPQATGVEMEPMVFACEDSTGKILFNI
jgi:hypothetical protein